MPNTLDGLYAQAAQAARAGSRTLFYATRFFPPELARAAHATFWFSGYTRGLGRQSVAPAQAKLDLDRWEDQVNRGPSPPTTSAGRSRSSRDLGLRSVHEARDTDPIAELELRGGTHLVLVLDAVPGSTVGSRRSTSWSKTSTRCTTAWSRRHRCLAMHARPRDFTFHDPDGYVVTVNSSHVVGDGLTRRLASPRIRRGCR